MDYNYYLMPMHFSPNDTLLYCTGKLGNPEMYFIRHTLHIRALILKNGLLLPPNNFLQTDEGTWTMTFMKLGDRDVFELPC